MSLRGQMWANGDQPLQCHWHGDLTAIGFTNQVHIDASQEFEGMRRFGHRSILMRMRTTLPLPWLYQLCHNRSGRAIDSGHAVTVAATSAAGSAVSGLVIAKPKQKVILLASFITVLVFFII